ncbi:MAG: SDR family oxidoreductase [Myxococcota bacterium]
MGTEYAAHHVRDRWALVTGASAGIGLAYARVAAAHGFDLVLTARREARLKELATELERDHGRKALVVPADLAEPDAPQRLFDAVQQAGVSVDMLVNNAGFGSRGYFRKTEWKDHAAFLQVMVTSVVHLTHLFEPGMQARGWGKIVHIASLAGLMPGSAGRTLYGPAKAFLIKFAEALAQEHQDDGVTVTAVCPGFTYSEFHDVVGNRDAVGRLPKLMWMEAETVAQEAFAAAMEGKVVVVNGAPNRAIATLMKHAPAAVARELTRRGAPRAGGADE